MKKVEQMRNNNNNNNMEKLIDLSLYPVVLV